MRLRAALADPATGVVVTLDGDGQHDPDDVPRLVRAWSEGAELVVGERASVERMPLRSRIGNRVTTRVLRALSSRFPRDTQSGFRALDRSLVEDVVRRIEGARYETELRILLLAMLQRRSLATVPIETRYLDGNRSSHFRPVVDSLRIYGSALRAGVSVFVDERRHRSGT